MQYLLLPIFFFAITGFAQEYWQQEVDYIIDVHLDDEDHILRGFEKFEYTNNSPNELTKLYIHIWPNAYKDENSALARQQFKNGNHILKYGKKEDKGWIDSLDFKVNNKKTEWSYHHHEDIVILELTEALPPGGKLMVSTPFRVKIPSGSISRLGHIEQSYQITQWYPKPAVYDKNGWHHMPYINQGEFYSEYGTFDVNITVPENYVVAATGDLQTESEIEFLNALAKKTAEDLANSENPGTSKSNEIPASSKHYKTLRYTQSNVHDFAWFADKRYKVLKGEVELPNSKRRVTSWAMYTPKNEKFWKNAIEYLNDAIYYYSLWNGNYPYNNVTAVDGTISAGGGMEYPNITVIGNSSSAFDLEVVIVHEVGHNWFYGQLGTNERVHGWMDEGLNTLNELRYVQTKYPGNTALSNMVMNGRFHLNDLSHHDLSDITYRVIAGIGEDQPIETHSVDFAPINYGVIMYQKTGLVFTYLKDYLGDELFDECMRTYYSEWEFKHPQPEDLREVLERVSKKDLGWLFDDLINKTNHIDYKVTKVRKHNDGFDVWVKNNGQVDGPIEVATLKEGEVLESKWVEPGKKWAVLHFESGFDRVTIDPGKDIPELNRQNNSWKKNGLFKKLEPPKIEFLFGDNESEATNIFWTPTIGGNVYDKFMVGVALHNYSLPYSKVNYLFMPFYSFGRQFVSGVGELSVSYQPKQSLKLSRLGISVKSFKHDTVYRHNDSYFLSIGPYWFAKIGHRSYHSPVSQTIRVQSIYKKDQFGPTHIEHAGGYAEYNWNYRKPNYTINAKLRNEYITNLNTSDQMARILFETTYSYRYKKRKTKGWIDVRAFIGKQYLNDFDKDVNGYQYSMSLAGSDGIQDLFVDEYYFARNNVAGASSWSQQRNENMGGFKSTSYYGTTSDLMTTGNIYLQLPIKPGIFGVFADFGAFWNNIDSTGVNPGTNSIKVNTAANAGLAIRISNFFGVYFPLWMSNELDQSFGNSSYLTKIRFTMKFNIMNKSINLSGLSN
jgi:hypothetical protein